MRLLWYFIQYHVLAIISLIKQTYYSINTLPIDTHHNGLLTYMPLHTQQLDNLISALEFQHAEGRQLQQNWINRSKKNYHVFSNMLNTQMNDWNQLFDQWNHTRTGTELEVYYRQKTYKALLKQTLYQHEYSLSRIPETMPCSLPQTAYPENVPAFKELCQLLQFLYSSSIQETKLMLVRHARLQHQKMVLYIRPNQPNISTLHHIWIQIPERTVPFWYLYSCSWYELFLMFIKFIVQFVYNIPTPSNNNKIQLDITI